MNVDQQVTYLGQAVRIIGIDVDPRADVHCVALSDPDTLIRARRDELTA